MPSTDNNAVAKILKLLALAEGNANESEAQNAMDKAHQMLEDLNLSLAEVRRSTKTGNAREDTRQKGGLYKWQRDLWTFVAEHNMCYYDCEKGLGKGQTYTHRVIGSAVNVALVTGMSEYLQGAIERLAQKWTKEQGYKSVFVRDAIIYREGMTARVTTRLGQLARERDAEAKRRQAKNSNGTDITIFDVRREELDLNRDFIMGYEPGTTAKMRAEREARLAEFMVQSAERDRIHNEKYQNDPEYAAEYDAEQAKYTAENEEWARNYEAKMKRAEARRAKRGTDAYRPLTKAEARRTSEAFYSGYTDGKDIGLDDQIGTEETATGIEG